MLELDGQWLPFPKQNVVGLNAGVSKQLYIPKYNSENPTAGLLKILGPHGYFQDFCSFNLIFLFNITVVSRKRFHVCACTKSFINKK